MSGERQRTSILAVYSDSRAPFWPLRTFLTPTVPQASPPAVPSLSLAGGRGPISSNRRMFLRLGTTDEFYNITLERPASDDKGYDVLFVNVRRPGVRSAILAPLPPLPTPALKPPSFCCQLRSSNYPAATADCMCRLPPKGTSRPACATAASPTARPCPWWWAGAAQSVSGHVQALRAGCMPGAPVSCHSLGLLNPHASCAHFVLVGCVCRRLDHSGGGRWRGAHAGLVMRDG